MNSGATMEKAKKFPPHPDRMPRYPNKKQSQIESQYEITADSITYLLTVRESSTSTLIYFGGQNIWCLELQVFPDNPIGLLSKIEYNELCTLKGAFKRGSGILQLVGLGMSYIREQYPHVTHLEFDDASFRECDTGANIDLPFFYYALYGQTWYMMKMNARPAKEFSDATAAFNAKKAMMTWEQFDAFVNTAYPLSESEIRVIWDSSATWQEFFQALRDATDIQRLCVWMAQWITPFIKRVAGLDFNSIRFTIPLENTHAHQVFSIIPWSVMRGGGRQKRVRTQRRTRRRFPPID